MQKEEVVGESTEAGELLRSWESCVTLLRVCPASLACPVLPAGRNIMCDRG